MSKGESSSVIIKSQPCNDDIQYFNNDKIKVEQNALDEVRTEVDLEDYIKEELIEVKQEEIIIKDEILSSSDTQNNSANDNLAIPEEIEPTCFNTERSIREKQFVCTFCQYKTFRKQDLKRHISLHAGVKNEKFRCAECEYKASKKMHLDEHMTVHTGERPFACNLCKFKTAKKSNLKNHMLKHTGEKPFTCNFCEFKTAHKISLRDHIMRHRGEKPFSCNLCEFKTAQKSYLKIHMKTHTHTGEKFCWNLYGFKENNKVDESLMKVKQKAIITYKNEIPATQKN